MNMDFALRKERDEMHQIRIKIPLKFYEELGELTDNKRSEKGFLATEIFKMGMNVFKKQISKKKAEKKWAR